MDNQPIIQSGQQPIQTACKDLRSEITYELVSGSDSEMSIVPTLLGRGRFAKVYKAWQRSAGHNVRPVAIKILHENIEQRSEQLFLQEISLLKKLTSASGINVISVLDILQLGPMVMCGNCGQIYHPRCPRCGEHLLERYDPKHEAYAALRCKDQSRCKYIVSGEHILNSAFALFQYPAKTCCTKDQGARAQRGTLINFVDRDAVVMELLEQGLPHFHESRRRTYARLCRQHGILLPECYDEAGESAPAVASPAAAQLNAPQLDTPLLRAAQPAELAYIQKVMLLEKVFLMVQLAESVAWLHGEQQIIHKDLAPDNIMIAALPDPAEVDDDWRGLSVGGLEQALTSLATYPSFSAKVIDFGLADQLQLTRNWYEEPVQNIATEKRAYLSPEALNRKRHIYQRLDFDPATRVGQPVTRVVGVLRLRAAGWSEGLAAVIASTVAAATGELYDQLLARLPGWTTGSPRFARAAAAMLNYAGRRIDLVADPHGRVAVRPVQATADRVLALPLFPGRRGLPLAAWHLVHRFAEAGGDIDHALAELDAAALPPVLRDWLAAVLDPARIARSDVPAASAPRTPGHLALSRHGATEPIPDLAPGAPLDPVTLAATLEYWLHTLRPDLPAATRPWDRRGRVLLQLEGDDDEPEFASVTADDLWWTITLQPRHWLLRWATARGQVDRQPIAWLLLACYARINEHFDEVTNQHEGQFQRAVADALELGRLDLVTPQLD